ncbi:MAG: RNA methyltransferase [Acidobacteriota bacterium]|nr:RNA methyltransferase [Acidobacteriota bacterium]
MGQTLKKIFPISQDARSFRNIIPTPAYSFCQLFQFETINHPLLLLSFNNTIRVVNPGQLCYKCCVTTEARKEKLTKVLSRRQPDLHVVLEEVTIAHNASAVARTCEAAGILNLHIISPHPENIVFNEAITTRAEKWLLIHFHQSTAECLSLLKSQGLKVAATTLSSQAVPHTEIDYCQPLALVFGNEAEGVSSDALTLADYQIHIPMVGLVQSLNLSVSAAIILYEAFRQRQTKGWYSERRLPSPEFEQVLKIWLANERPRRPFHEKK